MSDRRSGSIEGLERWQERLRTERIQSFLKKWKAAILPMLALGPDLGGLYVSYPRM